MTTTSTHVARISATLAVALWAAKAVAIGIAGGLGRSRFENPLFLVGLLAFLVATASLGVAATRGRPLWLRVLAGIAGPVLGFLLAAAIGALVTAVEPARPGWAYEEVNLWVVAPLALGLSWLLSRREARRQPGRLSRPRGARAA